MGGAGALPVHDLQVRCCLLMLDLDNEELLTRLYTTVLGAIK